MKKKNKWKRRLQQIGRIASLIAGMAAASAPVACGDDAILFEDIPAAPAPEVDAETPDDGLPGGVPDAGVDGPPLDGPPVDGPPVDEPPADAGAAGSGPGDSGPSDPLPPPVDGGPPALVNINPVAWSEAIQAVVVAYDDVVTGADPVTATTFVERAAVHEQAVWEAALFSDPDQGDRVDFFLEEGLQSIVFTDIAADPRFPLAGAFQQIVAQLPETRIAGEAYALVTDGRLTSMAVGLNPQAEACNAANVPADATLFVSHNEVSEPVIVAGLNVGTGRIEGRLIDPAANAACVAEVVPTP